MTKSTLAKAASAIAFLTSASKVLGFVREASLAAVFGATSDTDAYLVAQTISYLLSATASYALTTTFIPVYSSIREEQGNEAASRFATTAIRAVVCTGVALVAAGEGLAAWLVRIVAPGFGEQLAGLTTHLSRINLPMVVFQLLSGVLTGILHADGQFAVPTAASLLQNASIIISIAVFGSQYGIASVAIGALIGAILATVAMVPALTLTGFRWQGTFDLRDPGLKRVGILILPTIIGAGAGELNTLVDRILASRLPGGSVSALNYANRLMQLAPSIIGVSITTVVYPTLAKMAAKQDRKGFVDGLADSLSLVHFMLVPVAVGMLVLREPLIRIVFERGMFDAAATSETAWALLFLSPGIVVFTMRDLIYRAFFAMQDTTTPMLLGVAAVGVNIVLNVLLVGPFRHGGLALATTIAGSVGLVAGLFAFRRTSSTGFPAGRLLSSIARSGFASAVMGLVVWAVHSRVQLLERWQGSLLELVTVGFVAVIGALVYVCMVWILRVPELESVLGHARRAWLLLRKGRGPTIRSRNRES